jgi:hypothetical protein
LFDEEAKKAIGNRIRDDGDRPDDGDDYGGDDSDDSTTETSKVNQ